MKFAWRLHLRQLPIYWIILMRIGFKIFYKFNLGNFKLWYSIQGFKVGFITFRAETFPQRRLRYLPDMIALQKISGMGNCRNESSYSSLDQHLSDFFIVNSLSHRNIYY